MKKKFLIASVVSGIALATSLTCVTAVALYKKQPEDIEMHISSVLPLETPHLSLEGNTVSWDTVAQATSYKYYVNEGEYQTTTSTSLILNKGETVTVSAETTTVGYLNSEWSKPLSNVDVSGTPSYVTVSFRDTSLPSVSVIKGRPYNAPTSATKVDHTFAGWYIDPFFKESYVNGTVLTENTVLYAKWTPADYLKDTCYWLKGNNGIYSPEANTDSGWKLVPMHYSRLHEEGGHKYHIFYTYVQVTEPAQYMITNTTVHGDNSYYWKDNGANFTLNTLEYYKIEFSVEYQWDDLEHDKVNVGVTELHNENPWDTTKSIHFTDPAEILTTPVVTIDTDNDLASWPSDPNASEYEYSIDNGETHRINANSVKIYQGSYITVRAISSSPAKNSKWSQPYAYSYKSYPTSNYVYVYFHDAGMNSQKITKNTTVSKPTDPIRQGYEFAGWYTDLKHSESFDFTQNIQQNTVIYAKWNRLDIATYHVVDGSGNKLGELKYYDEEKTFNEYKGIIHVTSANTSIKVVSPTDYSVVYYVGPTIGVPEYYKMYYSNEKLWDVGTPNESHTYFTKATIRYYFTRPNESSWAAHAVRAYCWNGSTKNADWPGITMEYIKTNSYGEQIYKYEFDVSANYKNIIFNNGKGNGRQTNDLTIADYEDKTQFWPKDATAPKCDVNTRKYEE